MARRREQDAARRAQARPPARPAAATREPLRLPTPLASDQRAAIAIAAVAAAIGLAGYADTFHRYRHHSALPAVVATVGVLAVLWLERDAIQELGSDALRYATLGGAGPLFYWIVPLGCPGLIVALAGMAAWRLGRGTIFAPTAAATISTAIAFGPAAGLLVYASFAGAGVGGLLVARSSV